MSNEVLFLRALLPVTAVGIIQLKGFVVTRCRLWSTLQEWQVEGTHDAAKGWLQQCRIPPGGGLRGILWLMINSSRYLGCLKEQVRKAGVEPGAFSRRFLSLLLCLAVCLHVVSVFLVWRVWPCDKKAAVREDKSETSKKTEKRPLIKRFANTWKRKVRNVKVLSVKRKLKNNLYKRKWKNFRKFAGMDRWRKRNSNKESQLGKELHTYMIKNKKKTYIHLLKLAVTEMFELFLLMSANNIRRKLGLGPAPKQRRKSRERTKK